MTGRAQGAWTVLACLGEWRGAIGRLPAATALNDHVVVVGEDHLAIDVVVEKCNRGQLRGDTARRRDDGRVHRIDQRLDGRMVRVVEMLRHRVLALAIAEIRLKARWRQNPVHPADGLEVKEKRLPRALVATGVILVWTALFSVSPALVPPLVAFDSA